MTARQTDLDALEALQRKLPEIVEPLVPQTGHIVVGQVHVALRRAGIDVSLEDLELALRELPESGGSRRLGSVVVELRLDGLKRPYTIFRCD